MYLVGLHIYYKMIHGPYNIKFTLFLQFFLSQQADKIVSGSRVIKDMPFSLEPTVSFCEIVKFSSGNDVCVKCDNILEFS